MTYMSLHISQTIFEIEKHKQEQNVLPPAMIKWLRALLSRYTFRPVCTVLGRQQEEENKI